MHFRQAILKVENKTYPLVQGRSNSFDEIYVDFRHQPENGGERWAVFLHPKQDVTIQRLEIQFDLQLPPAARFFCNGFQSQSESRLCGLDEAISRLRFFAKKYLTRFGDERISGIPRGRGYLHSWTYTTVHGARSTADGDKALLFGSLNESTSFTLFLYDQPNSILTVRKDMDGLRLSHSFPALDFWVGQGSEQDVFERYFQLLEIQPPTPIFALGWTSSDVVSEEILLQNLENVSGSDLPFNFFQIGDGWQTAAGDWLLVKKTFPNGMGFLTKKIREKGLSPALRLAPFVAAKDSDLAKKHPGWFLKNDKGKLLEVGGFLALDFYNNEARNYLGGVFHQILDKWGFEMVSLDWLFAACLAPPPGKTRGQVMHEAMDFLRKLVGSKKIMACDVPLGSAFGLADFVGIGSRRQTVWESRFLSFLNFRERASALTSLRSSLGRWQLSGRAFRSGASEFILRNENQKLSLAQQQTLLTVNALLGNSLFTSDDVSQYSPEQIADLEAALDLRNSRILQVLELEKNVFQIDFENDGEAFSAFCNLTTSRTRNLSARTPTKAENLPPRTPTRANENGWLELQPFETLILKLPLLMEGL